MRTLWTIFLLTGLFSLHADENASLQLGASEADVEKTFGKAEGRMECGSGLVLIYSKAIVHLTDGYVDSLQLRDLDREKAIRMEQDTFEAKRKQREREQRKAAREAEEQERREAERQAILSLPSRVNELEKSNRSLEREKCTLQNEVTRLRGQLSQMQQIQFQTQICQTPVRDCKPDSQLPLLTSNGKHGRSHHH